MSSFTRFIRRSGTDPERRTPEDFYRRRAEKRRVREQIGLLPSVEEIANVENLIGSSVSRCR